MVAEGGTGCNVATGGAKERADEETHTPRTPRGQALGGTLRCVPESQGPSQIWFNPNVSSRSGPLSPLGGSIPDCRVFAPAPFVTSSAIRIQIDAVTSVTLILCIITSMRNLGQLERRRNGAVASQSSNYCKSRMAESQRRVALNDGRVKSSGR